MAEGCDHDLEERTTRSGRRFVGCRHCSVTILVDAKVQAQLAFCEAAGLRPWLRRYR